MSDERGEQVDTVNQLPCSQEPVVNQSGYRKQFYATTRQVSSTSSLISPTSHDELTKRINQKLQKTSETNEYDPSYQPELEIENQRLQSTIFILNQKIRVLEDAQREGDERLQAKIKELIRVNKMFENEIEEKIAEHDKVKTENEQLYADLKESQTRVDDLLVQDKKQSAIMTKMQFDIDELNQQLETANAARALLREQMQESNDKLIEMEEEVYKFKSKSHEMMLQLTSSQNLVSSYKKEIELLKRENSKLQLKTEKQQIELTERRQMQHSYDNQHLQRSNQSQVEKPCDRLLDNRTRKTQKS